MKKFYSSQNSFGWLRKALPLLTVLTVSVAVPQGSGGRDEEDPAPGRSPGPPLRNYATSEANADDFFSGVSFNDSVWCQKQPAPEDSLLLNVTFHHSLFTVADTLLPGIEYMLSVNSTRKNQFILKIFVLSAINGVEIGSWKINSSRKVCPDGEWIALDLEKPSRWSFYLKESANITFSFRYQLTSGEIYEQDFSYSAAKECVLNLNASEGSFGSSDLPDADLCKVVFPRQDLQMPYGQRDGLLVELTRLNIPCDKGGFIQFVEETNDLEEGKVHAPKKLCGKLEELNAIERKLYFPSLTKTDRPFLLIQKAPIFSLNYRLVDYCYNITFVARNGSLALNPANNLLCHFRVHLPYGNRVLLRLQLGEDKVMTTAQSFEIKAQNTANSGILKISSSNYTIKSTNFTDGAVKLVWTGNDRDGNCEGLSVTVWDGSLTWAHCSRPGDPKRDVQVWSQENVVTIKIAYRGTESDHLGFPVARFWYHAEPLSEIVGTCEFGEILVRQFCVSSVKVKMNWENAEKFCGKRGGHLASIRDEHSKNIIDKLLLNSPEYREHNSYWIGASDKIYEGQFRWSDGYSFSYSNWFPGWSLQGFYNRQPNDDGFSHQDCVEIRRLFPRPSGSRIVDGITDSYLWNDLDCNAKNFFLCERLENGESSELSLNQECNKTILLTREHPKAIVVSSGFPHQYPDNVRCETLVMAPSSFRLIVDFEELVMEKEPLCSYDYLELVEDSWNESKVVRKMCGDMSDKLKLLRYISQGSSLKFVFVSDYSHHYGGFKAKVSMESVRMECSDERYLMFNNSCYLFVSYPKVTWNTARQICKGMKAELASVQTVEEESFITGNIRNSLEYTISSAYWLGGFFDFLEGWKWTDGTPMEYYAWISKEEFEISLKEEDNACLSVRWVSSKTEKGHSASGLYWTSLQCKATGGYVCKKKNQVSGTMLSLNKTINGTEGHLTSPGYPNFYYHNLDYYVRLIGPSWTRLVVIFTKLDIENQADCLYDFVELRSGGSEEPEFRWCGNGIPKNNRPHFVSENNEVILRFHSDYSVAGVGFFAKWKAVDITGCPLQKLTSREGIIMSPNYRDFLLPKLNCTTIILAPPGKRIWLEFTEVNLGSEAKEKSTILELNLGENSPSFRPFVEEGGLAENNFVSTGEKMIVKLITLENPRGHGFRALYRTVSIIEEEEIVNLVPESQGVLHHLNYPANPPQYINFVQHLVAPAGHILYLEVQEKLLIDSGTSCPNGGGVIEVSDYYADINGSSWLLCETKSNSLHPTPPLAVASYLNTLHIKQKSYSNGAKMNATLIVKSDPNYKLKLLRAPEDGSVESCRPNPCQNGGKCLNLEGRKLCQCLGHFTGMFCALTLCELEPCLFGHCELTSNGYQCHCQSGYTGLLCDRKQSPCEDNPCEGRGECVEKSDSFHCRCHAWWEGPRCEKRMVHIPFKPLSERMLQEPFWLGLITVFVVLAIIGIVWCAKRHFPEKLEKLLAEEADRQGRSNASGTIRPPSIREQIHSSGGAVVVTNPAGTAGCPRTLFGRLGIRKSSLLGSSSTQRQGAATSRTFSLDDLLRPSPRRTPSPRKKHNNSVSSKRNPAEKKQILQQLICPTTKSLQTSKVTINELITLNEIKKRKEITEKPEWKETAFSIATAGEPDFKTDLNKLEKKVTFARLLNKVSAEMSSGSEAESPNPLLAKALSTPVSPATERKSRHSASSIHGSDSLSSSEIAISGSVSNSMLDIPSDTKRPTRLSYKNMKNASADSILEMFRSFTVASGIPRGKSFTPSSTPTPSSPQEDHGISDESSPISTTSGPADSPTKRLSFGTSIEIPVMDTLTAQKSNISGNNFLQPPAILLEIPSVVNANKGLSPIREMPSPMTSPALTPIMTRTENKVGKLETESSEDDENNSYTEEEKERVDLSFVQIHREEDKNDVFSPSETFCVDQNTFPDQNHQNSNFSNHRRVSDIIIPLLTVQEPSPPSTSPPGSFPGSPPPYKNSQFTFFSPEAPKRFSIDKPNSLDLPYPPPMITITCNVSEPESDTEPISPAIKNQNLISNDTNENSVGMSYLSPFSICSRADRTASESNLSSSGYSSMASPGPSRCGSNNPLCLSESEDHQHPNTQPPSRRPSPLLRTHTKDNPSDGTKDLRGRSDSETFSDDPLMESNDEGIGTDHLDEKVEEGDAKNAKELEVFIEKDINPQNFADFGTFIISNAPQRGLFKKCENLDCSTLLSPTSKTSLQLPTIVIQSDCCDKILSPVSSRSESPLSDKTLGFGRFSPLFYSKSKCDHLLFTDSDGLYDFPSSDCPPSNNKSIQAGQASHRKNTGRRRERRNSRLTSHGSKASSPTKRQSGLLEVPSKEGHAHRVAAQRKPSPKRRIRTQQPLSSSSSTESLNSSKSEDNRKNKGEKIVVPKPSEAFSKNSTKESFKSRMNSQNIENFHPRKIVTFRNIGHQIRFLRRLELGLKRKEKLIPNITSDVEDAENDPSLSLLPLEMKKSISIEFLHSATRKMRENKTAKTMPAARTSNRDALMGGPGGQSD